MPGLSKVIVLDPDARAGRQIQLGFHREGVPVEVAAVPAEAAALGLDGLAGQDAGLVVVGGSDGRALELVRQARALLDGARIDAPIVFAGRGVRRADAEAAGADEVVLQPAYLRDLVTIGRLLRGQPAGHRAHIVGNLAETTGVLTLVRALAALGRSAVLTLIRGLRRGEVRFFHGEVTSAQVGLIHGQAALHQLLLWTDARFDYHHEDVVRRQQIPLERDELFADADRFLAGVRDSSGALSPSMVLEQDHPRIQSFGKQIPMEVYGVLRMFDGHRVLSDVLEDSPYRVFETLRVAQLAVEIGLLRPTSAPRPRTTWRAVLAIEEWLVGAEPRPGDGAPGAGGAGGAGASDSGPVGKEPSATKGSRRKRKKRRAHTPIAVVPAVSKANIDWGALVPRIVGAEVGPLAGVVPAAHASGEITTQAREQLETLTDREQRDRLFPADPGAEPSIVFDEAAERTAQQEAARAAAAAQAQAEEAAAAARRAEEEATKAARRAEEEAAAAEAAAMRAKAERDAKLQQEADELANRLAVARGKPTTVPPPTTTTTTLPPTPIAAPAAGAAPAPAAVAIASPEPPHEAVMPKTETPEERARRDAEETAELEAMYRAEAEAAEAAAAAAADKLRLEREAAEAATAAAADKLRLEREAAEAAAAAAADKARLEREAAIAIAHSVAASVSATDLVKAPAEPVVADAASSVEAGAAADTRPTEPQLAVPVPLEAVSGELRDTAAAAEPPPAEDVPPEGEPESSERPTAPMAAVRADGSPIVEIESQLPPVIIEMTADELERSAAPTDETIDEPSDGVIRERLASAETARSSRRAPPPGSIPVDDRPEDTTGEIESTSRPEPRDEPSAAAEPSIMIADLAAVHGAVGAASAAVAAAVAAPAPAAPTPSIAAPVSEASVAELARDAASAGTAFTDVEEDFFRAGQEKSKRPASEGDTFADLDEGYQRVGFWGRLLGRKPPRR